MLCSVRRINYKIKSMDVFKHHFNIFIFNFLQTTKSSSWSVLTYIAWGYTSLFYHIDIFSSSTVVGNFQFLTYIGCTKLYKIMKQINWVQYMFKTLKLTTIVILFCNHSMHVIVDKSTRQNHSSLHVHSFQPLSSLGPSFQ